MIKKSLHQEEITIVIHPTLDTYIYIYKANTKDLKKEKDNNTRIVLYFNTVLPMKQIIQT